MLNLVLCLLLAVYVICQIILCVQLIKICKIIENYALPWDRIEAITNAWKSQTPNHAYWAGSDTAPTKTAKSTGIVAELPPEVIAPSLKKMRRTSGFGSNIGDQNSDS